MLQASTLRSGPLASVQPRPTSETVKLMNQSRLTTTAITALRIILGFLFAAHGWQKFNEWTIAGTQASFAKMGVPAAEFAAPAIAVLELAGGIALILGILTRVVAALLVLDMLGALFMVHAAAGGFAKNCGYDGVVVLHDDA